MMMKTISFVSSDGLEGIQDGKWWKIDYFYLKFQVLGLNMDLTFPEKHDGNTPYIKLFFSDLSEDG